MCKKSTGFAIQNIQKYLDYGLILWGTHVTDINKLLVLEKRNQYYTRHQDIPHGVV